MSLTTIVALTDDPVILRNLRRIIETPAVSVINLSSIDDLNLDEQPPLAVVIGLEQPQAMEMVKQLKKQWPETLVAGFLLNPLPNLWELAERAGCDLVASRGALAMQLRQKLETWETDRGKRRLRLFDLADIGGRLGVVARLDEAQGVPEPIAVYHLGNEIFAVADTCPHAGACLSEGELGESIITCPLHGSRFDVKTGERVRGPADLEIKTYVVEIEGSQVFLRLT